MAYKITDTATVGSIFVYFNYAPNEDDATMMIPVMCLCRNVMRGKPGAPTVAFPITEAWRFAEDRMLVEKAAQYAATLFGSPTSYDVRAVADAIQSRLADLIGMPPPSDITQEEFRRRAENAGVDVVADGTSLIH